MDLRLANAPVSWGVDFADDRSNPPWTVVLDGISAAGYRWTELGPIGYLPEDPELLSHELEKRDLGVAGAFLFEPFHERRELPRIRAAAHRACRLLATVGGRYLVLIDLLSRARSQTAGDRERARRLDADDFRALVAAFRQAASIARQQYGVTPVVHPHAGTYVEFDDEIDALLAALDSGLVDLCIDTGHCAYAGVDPLALYARYSDRVPYLHLKDVAPAVQRRARRESLDFDAAVAAGVFCPLGKGTVDFAGLRALLEEAGFSGFATIEQDRDLQAEGDPIADAINSLAFLQDVGISETAAAT